MNDAAATIGHNRPPETIPFDETPEGLAYLMTQEGQDWRARKIRVDELAAIGNRWVKERPEITDADMAGKLEGFLEQARKEFNAVDADRKKYKKPHDDAAKLVDSRFNPLATVLDTIAKLLKPRRAAWLLKEEKRLADERRAAEEAAIKAMLEEEAARQAALSGEGDVIANTIAADEARRKADEALAATVAAPTRATVKSDYGARAASLPARWVARVTDLDKAFAHYRANPKVLEVLTLLASAEARGGSRAIPGCEVYDANRVAAP
jgi:hypothetical protein